LLVDTSKNKFRVAKIKIECPQCKRAYEYMTDKEANDKVGKNFALIAFMESSGLKL
jgi:phage FluMu protein Com